MIAKTLKSNSCELRVVAERAPYYFIDIPLYRHFYSGNKLYYKLQRDGKEMAIEELTGYEVFFNPLAKVYLVKGVFRKE